MTIFATNRFVLKKCLVMGLFFAALLFLSACEPERASSQTQAEWISSVQNCWPCIMYKTAFDAVNQLAVQLFPLMAEKATMVMAIGLLFWLAFTTGKMIVSLHEPEIKKYVHGVSIVLFKAIVVGAILYQPENFVCFVDMIASPVITSFTHLSRIVITANPGIDAGLSFPNEFLNVQAGTCDIFSPAVKYELQDIIYRVYVALNGGISLGYNFMVQSNFINWILGPLIIWFFFIMMLIFPWMFVDSFLRLGATLLLGPFFLVMWVFPSTKSKVKTAWDTIFGATMQLLIACIYIGLVVGVIHLFEKQMWPGLMGEARQSSDPTMLAKFRRLSTEAISFFALLIIMNKMQKNIPNISGALGGDSAQSSVIGLFNGLKELAINVGKIALGAALAACGVAIGAQLMRSGVQNIASQVAEGAGSMASGTDSDDGAGGKGLGPSGDKASSKLGKFEEASKKDSGDDSN